jgi:hypothetical protein
MASLDLGSIQQWQRVATMRRLRHSRVNNTDILPIGKID